MIQLPHSEEWYDDKVDEWHDSKEVHESLQTFLDMNDEEFEAFMTGYVQYTNC